MIEIETKTDTSATPDPEHVCVDPEGVTWYRFTVEYTDQDAHTFSFDIWATSAADAEKRLHCIKNTAVVHHQVLRSQSMSAFLAERSATRAKQS